MLIVISGLSEAISEFQPQTRIVENNVAFLESEKFIKCDYEIQKDEVEKDEDLMSLAQIAVRRLEKLTSINKKISSETINSIKQLMIHFSKFAPKSKFFQNKKKQIFQNTYH